MILALESQELEPQERPRPGRRKTAMVVGPIIVLVICSIAGDTLTTTWADRHPLALIALNARNRILILTTNQLDAFSYYAVGTVRLLLSDPLFFLLGTWYGDGAVRWLEARSPSYGKFLRSFERGFAKASYPLVFAMPNNFICLFAGAAGMSLAAFITLNVSGTLARLFLIRWLGDAFQAPIDDVLDFFARYRLPLFLLSVALISLQVWNDRRKGRGEISSALSLETELAADDEPA